MYQIENKLQSEHIRDYIFAGNSTITVYSHKCGDHFTYKIVRDKFQRDCYRVYLLYGQDNSKDFRFIGVFYNDFAQYVLPGLYRRGEYAQPVPLSIQVIRFVLENAPNLPETISVLHSGRCAKCGRKLTTPESLMTGFGPKCRRIVR